jgi:hypothetical protein
MNRTFGDFARWWGETNGLPTKVVVQPIPTVPIQSDPDIQIPESASKQLPIGDQVTCSEPTGAFRPCTCGCSSFTVREGRGPHVAQLVCDCCERGGRWLSRRHFETA